MSREGAAVVNPARAGMIPFQVGHVDVVDRKPRASGDDPLGDALQCGAGL